MIVKVLSLVVFSVFSCCVGCSKTVTECDLVDTLPNGVELKSGDIIVARSGGFLAASMASLGKPKSTFGHSAVYFKDEGGCGRIIHMQPNGLCVVTPQEFWSNYYHNGIVRLKPEGEINYQVFNKECQKLVKYNKSEPISAGSWGKSLENASFKGEGEYPEFLYCITLVNILYRKSELAEPYEKCFDISDEPILSLIYDSNDDIDLNVLTIPSIFANDKFELISDYLGSKEEDLKGKIDDTMLQAVNKYLAEGYYVSNPPLYVRAVICGAYALKEITMPILPAGVKNFLKEISTVRKVNVLYTLNKYVKLVREESLKILLTDNEADIEAVTLAIAEKYKDKAFE